jgi:hypothetical protein
VEVVVEVVAVVLAAVAPFALGASLPSLGASPLLSHLRLHICHNISHLLHHLHLGCNQWINSGWWRIWRIHLCFLLCCLSTLQLNGLGVDQFLLPSWY